MPPDEPSETTSAAPPPPRPDAPDEPAAPPETGFAALGLSAEAVATLRALTITDPTAIQTLAIPPLLAGRDVLGQARTGTGKTAAFALPLLARLDLTRTEPQVLVLTPTRELAEQVSRAFRELAGKRSRARVVAVYGGQAMGPQIRQIDRGAHVIVGTPGRVLDMLDRGVLRFAGLDRVVLDEADEMLRMGFADELERIRAHMVDARPRQTALFSATFPAHVRRVAQAWLRDPVDARVSDAEGLTVAAIDQQVVIVDPADKATTLDRLLEVEAPEAALVFVNTRAGCDELAEFLDRCGHPAASLHGDLGQPARDLVLQRLRDGRIRVVVATDVAARGLDVEALSHVINFEPPFDLNSYVHRIGRTGRAGRSGAAITLIHPRERGWIAQIERHTGQRLRRRARPGTDALIESRTAALRERLLDAEAQAGPGYLALVDELLSTGIDPRALIAGAARLLAGERPLDLAPDPPAAPEEARFVVLAGRFQGVRPGDIVGALCNEYGFPRRALGQIVLNDNDAELYIDGALADKLAERVQRLYLRGRPVALVHDDGGADFEERRAAAERATRAARPPKGGPPRRTPHGPGKPPAPGKGDPAGPRRLHQRKAPGR